MKLEELFEQQRVIEGDVVLPPETTELDFKGVIVTGNFSCSGTDITSLEGAPSYVGGAFHCHLTKITSLEGAPSHVGGAFHCHITRITSLHNIHKQIKYIGGKLGLPIGLKSHILGVMYIGGLKEILFSGGNIIQAVVADIVNKHLQGDRNIHDVQEELLEAGLREFARL